MGNYDTSVPHEMASPIYPVSQCEPNFSWSQTRDYPFSRIFHCKLSFGEYQVSQTVHSTSLICTHLATMSSSDQEERISSPECDASPPHDQDRRPSRSHSPGAAVTQPPKMLSKSRDKTDNAKVGSGRSWYDKAGRSKSVKHGERSRSGPCHDPKRSKARACDNGGHDAPGAVGSAPGGSVLAPGDMAGLGSMIATLIDQKMGQFGKTHRQMVRSPTPLSSEDDSGSSSDTESDSDAQDRPDYNWSGHGRAPGGRAKRKHQPRQRMRSDDGGRSAGSGSDTDEWDAGSTGDPFAALNKFAAKVPLFKSAPIEDKYAATINDLEKYFDGGDKVGDSIQDSFASIFEAGLRRQPNDRMLLDIMKKYPRPQTVPLFNVPKTNDCVWEAMKRGPQVVDAGLQKVQTLMSKSLVPVISMIDTIGKGGVADKPLSEYLTPFTDIVRLSSAAFSLLSQTCKDIIRNDMGYPISKLCNWKYKVGVENLFEDDLMKKLKELKEQNMHFKPHKPSASRFSSRGDRDAYRVLSKPLKRYHKKGRKHFPNKSRNFAKKKPDCEYNASESEIPPTPPSWFYQATLSSLK